jgi:hypothetical protein
MYSKNENSGNILYLPSGHNLAGNCTQAGKERIRYAFQEVLNEIKSAGISK